MTLLAIAVPLNIGYAQIAGLPPTAGLYALIVPGVVYALLASTRQVVASPDAAAAALVASSLGGLAAAGRADYLTLAFAQAILCGSSSSSSWSSIRLSRQLLVQADPHRLRRRARSRHLDLPGRQDARRQHRIRGRVRREAATAGHRTPHDELVVRGDHRRLVGAVDRWPPVSVLSRTGIEDVVAHPGRCGRSPDRAGHDRAALRRPGLLRQQHRVGRQFWRAVRAVGTDQVAQLILDLEAVTDVDVTGAENLESLRDWLRGQQITLGYSRAHLRSSPDSTTSGC